MLLSHRFAAFVVGLAVFSAALAMGRPRGLRHCDPRRTPPTPMVSRTSHDKASSDAVVPGSFAVLETVEVTMAGAVESTATVAASDTNPDTADTFPADYRCRGILGLGPDEGLPYAHAACVTFRAFLRALGF
ncbi:hypothetical protein FA95DRAFT_1609734 [Auriscalpium vulgare]|uniref:Uncharacterized protein n=1 Tax=Auriscalpium vulgare TaxID=40419 RepID=A0ACB8RHK4_9AGAM|nr:hypothetical protein FA95DRAFT_1609734 [Auriscalpium vulgare]